MADVDEVLFGGKFHVDAARLEDHSDLAAHSAGIERHVVAQDQGASGGGKHQRGEDAEHGGLAAAVGAEQAEDLRALHVEGDAVEGHAVAVLVAQAFDLDHRPRRVAGGAVELLFLRPGFKFLVVKLISPQVERVVCVEPVRTVRHAALFSIISAKSRGR